MQLYFAVLQKRSLPQDGSNADIVHIENIFGKKGQSLILHLRPSHQAFALIDCDPNVNSKSTSPIKDES